MTHVRNALLASVFAFQWSCSVDTVTDSHLGSEPLLPKDPRPRMRIGWMREIAPRLQVVVALLVAMLAVGRGLPGLVEAMVGAPTHVCSCANGGDHSACPICNPLLEEHGQQLTPSVQRMPCGDPRVAVGTPGEPSTLPAPLLAMAPARLWVGAPRAEKKERELVFLEPSTPPPRRAAT